MISAAFETDFFLWERQAAELNPILRPILTAPIDTSVLGWKERLANAPHPADQVGVRGEVTALFDEIVSRLTSLDAEERQLIFDLMHEHCYVMHSALLSGDRNTPVGFRRRLLLTVIEDQGHDPRDTIVSLLHFREQAPSYGFDADELFREMAAIASDRIRHGWGSMRDLLLRY